MRRLFSSLILFMIGSANALAASFTTSGYPEPVANHTDLSIAYLAQVFGTVGNTLQGTSGQMLGMLFSKFNEGVMVVAGVWLVYTVITIVLRSAMDGSFMGPNKNVFWIIVRIALAFAMLIPGPMTGYNVIQDLVMKVVVQGVSLADQTWAFGLGYIGAGGSLWHRPSGDMMDGKNGIMTNGQANNIYKTIQRVFANEVCMVKSSILAQSTSSNTQSGSSVANTSMPSTVYNVVEDNKHHTFLFPGVGNSANFSSALVSGQEEPACGSVSWGSVPHSNCDNNGGTCQIAKAAVSQIVYDVLPAAKEYACSLDGGGTMCSGVSSSSLGSDAPDDFFNALVNFANAMHPVAQGQSNRYANLAKSFIPDAISSGWMMAGRYYWDLSAIQSHYKSVSNISNYMPTVTDATIAINNNSSIKDIVKSAKTASDGYNKSVIDKLNSYRSASSKGDTGGASPNVAHSVGNWVISAILGPIIGDIMNLFALFSTHAGPMGMGPDPIMFLHNVGMRCIAIAGDIWLGLAVLIFGITAATVVCQSTLNLSTPIEAAANWIKPPMMLLAAALLGVGVLLGYYVPLYPFMLFIFGVISWIIAVIEAMVAAPLVAFGLTHPEGHDFLGEAKQGLMLLLSVFLRPVLMVLGLISGMILSYVSLRILVYTYSGFLQDIFYQVAPIKGGSGSILASAAMATTNVAISSGSITGLIMSIFCFPLMLAIFAGLVYVVTTQCFSLIHVLPDQTLRWIGVPAQSSGTDRMAQQMQGVTSSMAGQAGRGANEGMKESGAGLERANQEKERSGEGAGSQGSTVEHSTSDSGGDS